MLAELVVVPVVVVGASVGFTGGGYSTAKAGAAPAPTRKIAPLATAARLIKMFFPIPQRYGGNWLCGTPRCRTSHYTLCRWSLCVA